MNTYKLYNVITIFTKPKELSYQYAIYILNKLILSVYML